MPFCINCGAEVRAEDNVCKECGYDPKVRGKRIRPDRSTIEGFEHGMKPLTQAVKEKEVTCTSCGSIYMKSLKCCSSCGEKNPYYKSSSLLDRFRKKMLRR